MHAIYSITFLGSTGRQYIGSAVDFRTRKLKHTGDLRRGKHCNIHLSRAFKKYGESVMSITVIEEVADKGDLIQREQCHIDMHDFKMLYNLSPTAGSMLGYKHTEETRAKLSKRVLSEERKTQIGLQHKGKIIPEAMRVKIRDFQTGRKKSAETIKKLTAARRKSCGKIVLRV